MEKFLNFYVCFLRPQTVGQMLMKLVYKYLPPCVDIGFLSTGESTRLALLPLVFLQRNLNSLIQANFFKHQDLRAEYQFLRPWTLRCILRM